MKLVIVESPTKARTIERFVGKDYKVESSYGHIRDLPTSTLGVDVENDFIPKYVTPRKAQKNVTALKKIAKKADEVILATDEDREGEAIAWHLKEILKIENAKRIVFHEITKKAITEALKHPRALDEQLFEAQQARRILDRLVGYKLSPFLWKKVMRGLSAGRVQSVALKLIIEREEEREAFKPQEYWTITAELSKIRGKEIFESSLIKLDGRKLDKFDIKTDKEAKKIVNELNDKKWAVSEITKKEVKKSAPPPFTTSTLQQQASSKMGYSAKQTMYLAQQLYEGIEINKESTGLITYMRTDSLNLSPDAIKESCKFINDQYGKDFAASGGRVFKTKSKGAQEAHEAIRPTDVNRTPESLKKQLNPKLLKLYTLIWQRFVASQMTDAIFDSTSIDITAGNALFRTSGQVIKFKGYLKVWPLASSDSIIPAIEKDENLDLKKLSPLQHFTQPPPRYSDATLIKTLEQYGIGRPSTYAPTLSTLDDRGYTQKDNNKRLQPTEVGRIVNSLIVKHFPEVVDMDFTAKMEEDLDKIASGEKKWVPLIKAFYEPFEKNLEEKMETVKKRDMTEPTDEVCNKCGKPMIIKHGRFGKFVACTGFPDCKNTVSLPPKSLNVKCPECTEGELVERMTRKRRMFYGCSRYPDCKYATWKRPQTDEND